MRLISLTLVLALAVPVALGSPADDREMRKLNGVWRLVHFEADGGAEIEKLLLIFDGGQITTLQNGQVRSIGRIKMRAGKHPTWIDFKFERGNPSENMVGICSIHGNRMRLCARPQGQPRPTRFAAKGEAVLAVLIRE